MDGGRDFLRTQVNNAVMQHRTLVENLEERAKQADDVRYRELCSRHLPRLHEQQRELEAYGAVLGQPSGGGVSPEGVTGVVGDLLGKARSVVDAAARQGVFYNLVGDIIALREAQDTFGTFAAVGDRIGEPRLAEVGRSGEALHDDLQRDFNRLAHELFVEFATRA